MRKYWRNIGLVFMCLLAFAPVSFGANLIKNGSFELGTSAPDATTNIVQIYQSSASNPSPIADWTIFYGTVDWFYDSYLPAYDGDRALDLEGQGMGGISQSFDTVLGQTYEVSFFLSGNPNGAPLADTILAMVQLSSGSDITSYEFTYNEWLNHTSKLNMNYKEFTFTFEATGDNTTLSFLSLENTGYGAILDNVSVNAVPIPPALIIFGSGLVGLIGLKRRNGLHA